MHSEAKGVNIVANTVANHHETNKIMYSSLFLDYNDAYSCLTYLHSMIDLFFYNYVINFIKVTVILRFKGAMLLLLLF